MKVAVAHPCDQVSLESAVAAAKLQLITPILVGPEQRIRDVAAKHGLDISAFEIVDAEYSQDSAEKAVALVREGRAEALMKGSLHTDELMGAVVSGTPDYEPQGASATASSWMFPIMINR